MTIEYGEENFSKTWYEGKVVSEMHSYTVRQKIATDQEELAAFIQFQRESKGNPHFSFKRETNNKGTRYIVREYID